MHLSNAPLVNITYITRFPRLAARHSLAWRTGGRFGACWGREGAWWEPAVSSLRSAGDPPGQLQHEHQLKQCFQQTLSRKVICTTEKQGRVITRGKHRLSWVNTSNSAREYLPSERHLQHHEGSRQSEWRTVIHQTLQYQIWELLLKWQGGRFKTDKRFFFFAPWAVNFWNLLPQEVVEPASSKQD